MTCADHGDLLGAHGLFFKDISAFEEIYQVPLIVRGPGIVRDAVCDEILAVAAGKLTKSEIHGHYKA